MVLDPQDAVAPDTAAPGMLHRPSEPAAPRPRVGDADALRSLRAARQRDAAGRQSLRQSARSWAAKVTGRADRRLLQTTAEATEATAIACDAVADRLAAQEALTGDVAATFGEELTRLRAEVLHLRSAVAALQAPTDE